MARGGARGKLREYRRKRDFGRTPEPSGEEAPAESSSNLQFVIQKHAASHLHFDFRLELDGVMKSWAVPKGPSVNPADKRLAMEVEDHPISYNEFEGTIPQGEYGGGTVMLWDRGTYGADGAEGAADEAALRRAYRSGRMDLRLDGERLQGRWTLVRTEGGEKPKWLLMKKRDEHASQRDITAEEVTSVVTGRTMEEITEERDGPVWRSNRSQSQENGGPADVGALAIEPMYATLAKQIPTGSGWTFEPKLDGIRVLAFTTPETATLVTRNRNDKSRQFPEIVEAVRALSAKLERPLVLDGEIVALKDGVPARFQELQQRMHLTRSAEIAREVENTPAAFMVFDLLLNGPEVLLAEPWSVRRRALEKVLRGSVPERLNLVETSSADPRELLETARESGWEGIIAKRKDAVYRPGERSKEWLKLKVEHRQEFVVGGYTEPRQSRQFLGAILLGYFEDGELQYAGHTGGGFTQQGLADMHRRLKPLERKTSPFREVPRTNEKAHWVRPEVVVEVKFSEWTADGKLRHPIFLGIRDDKDAREVTREGESVQARSAPGKGKAPTRKARSKRKAAGEPGSKKKAAGEPRSKKKPAGERPAESPLAVGKGAQAVAGLEKIGALGGEGELRLGGGSAVSVTNLDKVYFPRAKLTKGDLLRYYAEVWHMIVPVMRDRPLVLKRFPHGIDGQSFYQQKAPEGVPPGVRVEEVVNEDGERQERLVGGDLATLLYTVQLGAISVDPWHSRIQALEYADYTILDLDPGPGASFGRVVDVAGWVKEELDELGLNGVIKTSGATGLHIFLPLSARTGIEAALLLAQLIATSVANKHPREATIERSVRKRPRGTVYVDYLQNIRGKTVACAYSARAKPGATVSTPLRWDELTNDLDPREFTIETAPHRFARTGDLWAEGMRKRNSVRRLLSRQAAG